MENKNYSDQEGEIIEIKESFVPESQRVKIKIKERVNRQGKKKGLIALRKIILILSACLAGLYFGSKAIERYFNYWKKPQIEYLDTQDKEGTHQLKAGETFSVGQQ